MRAAPVREAGQYNAIREEIRSPNYQVRLGMAGMALLLGVATLMSRNDSNESMRVAATTF